MGVIGRIKREMRHLNRRLHPITGEKALEIFRRFGLVHANCLMVHSSLSACGQIRGGSAAVVDALRAWLGDGDLVMPTHTYCYPDKDGQAPLYDPAITPSVVGAITNYFWQRPGVVRSLHPTHSLACQGPGADQLCRDHNKCDTPCGAGTPYQRLVDCDCGVLMIGATLNTYTLFHTAEDAAQMPYLYEPAPYLLKVRNREGHIETVSLRRQDMHVPRAFAEMADWLEQRGLLKRQRLGLGELLFIPRAGEAHRRVVEALRMEPFLLVAEQARTQIAARFGL